MVGEKRTIECTLSYLHHNRIVLSRIKIISGAFYKISHSVVFLNNIADLGSWLCPTLLRIILDRD